ncbi:MAG: hypothetical protein OEV87_12270 [Phycisphaerae bacterium]|nr:hypothetical protein [Phycisphaerae bacterium]
MKEKQKNLDFYLAAALHLWYPKGIGTWKLIVKPDKERHTNET